MQEIIKKMLVGFPLVESRFLVPYFIHFVIPFHSLVLVPYPSFVRPGFPKFARKPIAICPYT